MPGSVCSLVLERDITRWRWYCDIWQADSDTPTTACSDLVRMSAGEHQGDIINPLLLPSPPPGYREGPHPVISGQSEYHYGTRTYMFVFSSKNTKNNPEGFSFPLINRTEIENSSNKTKLGQAFASKIPYPSPSKILIFPKHPPTPLHAFGML